MAIVDAHVDQVQKAYIAYYGRPADKVGLDFWTNQLAEKNGDLAGIIDAFGNSAEAKSLFGGLSHQQTVNTLFNQLFGRDADVDGLLFYANGLASGSMTAQSIALNILNGAQNEDATIVANKLAVAKSFTGATDTADEIVAYSGDAAAGAARAMLSTVNDTTDTAAFDVNTTIANIVADSTDTSGSTFTLTNGSDKETANVFNSGLVFTPGGDDRINSLQDEDILTGTGENPTLNADLGNANDNGATTITPDLNGIEVLNLRFTGSGVGANGAVNQLDLQDAEGITDAININRINDGVATATIDNIKSLPATLSISNSGQTGQSVAFNFTDGAVNGSDDAAAVALSDVNLAALTVQERGANPDQGVETLNLASNGGTNALGVLNAEDLKTLNITGDQGLTLGTTTAVTGAQGQEAVTYTAGLGNVAGSLTKVDASALTGALDITLGTELNAGLDGTSGVSVQLEVTAGNADDTFRLAQGSSIDAATGNTDTLDGGEGNNKLVLLGGGAQNVAAGTSANLKNIQSLEVRTGHDALAVADVVTVDADAFDKLASVYVRNEGQQVVLGNTVSAAEAMTVNLNDLSAEQGQAITLAHGTSGNNGIANNTLNVNLKNAAGTADVASVTIQDAANANARFNVQLSVDGDNAAGTQNAGAVESVTITDNDTESNTIALASVAEQTSNITLKGGEAGDFLNLDTTTAGGNGGIYGYDVTGATTDANGFIVDLSGTATQARVVADVVDASEYAGNVVVRASSSDAATGTQKITMGAGNDTVIFDALLDNRAGLTISDTVVGGAGTDTLVIDGNVAASTIALSASEWTNVSGFENIRLVNAGAGSNYQLTLTDALINSNKDDKGLLNIINDNDTLNDVANAADTAGAAAESNVTIDGRSLSATTHFTYNGEEGASATVDRFILSDANINGGNIIDGGAVNNVGTAGNSAANTDTLEVRNNAVVTVGDLEGITNVGRLAFNSDEATAQTLTLQLNDSIVNAMADSYHTATVANSERLTVIANDGSVAAPAAGAALNIDASALTGASALTVTGDTAFNMNDVVAITARVSGGANNINLNGGTDTLNVSGAATTAAVDTGANTLVYTTGVSSVTDTVQSIETYDFSNFTGQVTFTGSAANETFVGNASVNQFVFGATAAANGADTFNSFTSGADTLNVAAFETAGAAVAVAGAQTTTAGTVYVLSGAAAGSADSAAAAAAALSGAAVWTDANATAWVVVSDDNSSAIYEFVDTAVSADEVAAGELTLVATIGGTAAIGDIVI